MPRLCHSEDKDENITERIEYRFDVNEQFPRGMLVYTNLMGIRKAKQGHKPKCLKIRGS